jgi:hypothetical protein
MRRSIVLLLLSISFIATAQSFKEKGLETEIREVTVFLSGAQIFESGNTSLNAGKTILKIKGLPPYLDPKSIQVKGEGEFTILSVNHKLNHLNELRRDEKLDSLRTLSENIQASIEKDNARLAMLGEKLSLLNSNKTIGGTNNGVSIVQLKQAIELFESEIMKIKEEEIRIRATIEKKKREDDQIRRQLKELHDKKALPTSEIEVRVETENSTAAKFRVTYLVDNAGWFPKYDVRVKDVNSALEITYKAEVYQNTGADWKNVKLRFSNANPNQSGTAPVINTWFLNFARNTIRHTPLTGRVGGIVDPHLRVVHGTVRTADGQPLPGANVLVKGSTIGTTTDVNGNYSLTLPAGGSTLVFSFVGYEAQEIPASQQEINLSLREDQTTLSEVVVTGYSSSRPIRIRGIASTHKQEDKQIVQTTTIENQTTVEIEVKTPYTIMSNGEKLLVDLKKFPVDALYEYYAVPKLDKDAFLVARVVDWDQYNLLEGEANLYFEEAYVGRSILDAKSLEDTLDISLGRDKNIVIGREKVEEFCKRKSIGSNIIESRGFSIVVRNKKSHAINLTLFDQIPLSVVSDIVVEPKQLSAADFDEKTGKVTWRLNIPAQQQKELPFQYEVKYPRREKVLLE